MFLQSPMTTLTVATGALMFGAMVVIFGINTLNWLVG